MPIIVVAILVRRHCLHFRLLVLHHHFTRFVSVLIEESKSAKYSNIGPLPVAGCHCIAVFIVTLCVCLQLFIACLPDCLAENGSPASKGQTQAEKFSGLLQVKSTVSSSRTQAPSPPPVASPFFSLLCPPSSSSTSSSLRCEADIVSLLTCSAPCLSLITDLALDSLYVQLL